MYVQRQGVWFQTLQIRVTPNSGIYKALYGNQRAIIIILSCGISVWSLGSKVSNYIRNLHGPKVLSQKLIEEIECIAILRALWLRYQLISWILLLILHLIFLFLSFQLSLVTSITLDLTTWPLGTQHYFLRLMHSLCIWKGHTKNSKSQSQ